MAPEQVFGERALDHRVDLWALGVILHELLTGSRPIDAKNYGQIAKKLLTEPVRSIVEFRADLPIEVIVLVDHLLVRDCRDRLSDLREVVEVLAKYTDARRPTFGPPRPLRARIDPGSTAAPGWTSDRIYEPEAREHDAEASTLAADATPPLDTDASHVTSPRPIARPPRHAALAMAIGALGLAAIGVVVRFVFPGSSSAKPTASSSTAMAPSVVTFAQTTASVASPTKARAVAAAPTPWPSLPVAAAPSSEPTQAVSPSRNVPPAPTRATPKPTASTPAAPRSAAAASLAVAPPLLPPEASATGGLVTKPPF
jgi:serine/threonine-protein kinase